MPLYPTEPTDPNDLVNQLLGNNQPPDGFQASQVPSVSGWGTRQSRVPNNRFGVSNRQLIHWLVPEGPIVQMYVNPESMIINEKKIIQPQRTKGGYTVQYWGEELGTIDLQGTTGSSGKEGINVLRDLYRNEQLAMDPYALFLASQKTAEQQGLSGQLGTGFGDFLSNNIGGVGGQIIGAVGGDLAQLALGNTSTSSFSRPRPTLAYLATTVEMYFRGEVFRGYFTSFSVTESVDSLGLFRYSLNFTFTQKRGFSLNFMPWHRSATSGPSNSDPNFGVPYSYRYLAGGAATTPSRTPATPKQIADTTDARIQTFLNSF